MIWWRTTAANFKGVSLAFFLLMLSAIGSPVAAESESARASNASNENGAKDCVVLLHGLARTARSMRTMARGLRRAGFMVENVDYPSRKHDVGVLADIAVGTGFDLCRKHSPQPPHFVTHSLGGILVRYYMRQHPDATIGRVVMLGPPNGGSEVVDRLKNVPGFGIINGKVGRRLGTFAKDLPTALGPVDFDLGVIAGSRSYNLFLSRLLPKSR